MKTAAISYRVADFLKQFPPFQSMEESDLLALAASGRVKFHEADEYICWQGAEHGPFMFVIQQGTVSLWEDAGGKEILRDIRGAGDMLGIDRFTGSPACLHSAKAASDVVIYALPASDFEPLLAKYPQAARFLAAHASVAADYQPPDQRPGAHQMFLHDVVGQREPLACTAEVAISDAVRRMRAAGARAIAIVDAGNRITGVLTADDVLRSIAENDADLARPVETLMDRAPCSIAPEATVSQSVLAMAEAGAEVAAITGAGGRLHGLVTTSDLAPVFGDQPAAILREISHAAGAAALRLLQQRARAFVLEHLIAPSSVDWLARFAYLADVTILKRIAQLTGRPDGEFCWCLYGAGGREEALTPVAPGTAVILADPGARSSFADWHCRVLDALAECDYITPADGGFDASFYCAGLDEWKERFQGWVRDPVRKQIYRARPLFDLRPFHGTEDLWRELENSVRPAVRAEEDFVQILALDCLANLPPLTFFRDLVVEESGEQTGMFYLGQSALLPLADVGRVFGIAAGRVLGGSTIERFAMAQTMLPEQKSIFREASETFRVVLCQQARTGIRQHSDGSELPPALLGRHDRQVLKSGFRSILRLLEYTAECRWLEAR